MRLLLIIFFIFNLNVISWSESSDKLIVLPDKNGVKTVQNFIESAKKSIKLQSYHMANQDIVRSLIKMKKKNIDVKVILGDFNKHKLKNYPMHNWVSNIFKYLRKNKAAINLFQQHNIDFVLRGTERFFLYHPKAIIIDDEKALVGSFNYSYGSFHKGRNMGIFTSKSDIVQDLTKVFNSDFYNLPLEKLNSKNVAIAPGNYLQVIYDMIDKAQSNVYIYQSMLAHPGICDKLVKAAKKKKITIVVTNRYYNDGKPNEVIYCLSKFKNSKNIEVRDLRPPNPYIHAKMVLIDPDQAHTSCLIGSICFWEEGFDLSRELGIVIHDKKIINEIYDVFKKDYKLSERIA